MANNVRFTAQGMVLDQESGKILYTSRGMVLASPVVAAAATPHNPFGHPLIGPFGGPL